MALRTRTAISRDLGPLQYTCRETSSPCSFADHQDGPMGLANRAVFCGQFLPRFVGLTVRHRWQTSLRCSWGHTPRVAFRHLPPNSARFDYALFISAQLSTDEVSALRKVWVLITLRASLSGTFLQTLPDLVTPLKGHSLSPRSYPPTRSAHSERFGY